MTAGRWLAAGALLVLAGNTPAQDAVDATGSSDLEREIVVVARRYESESVRSTASIAVLRREDFERREVTQIDDALREVPGVQVVRDGPLGQFSRVFMRGAASNQTLVLVDGVPQNDATTGGGFDFNDLAAGAVERVEVLRGSYGVLYGSEAMGGVVNVTTRRGRGPLSAFLRVEGGSFATHRETLGLSAGTERHDFALTFDSVTSEGEREREEYTGREFSGRLGIRARDDLKLDLVLRHADSDTESPFDFATSGALPEDANIDRDRRTLSTGLTVTWDALDWLTVHAAGSWLEVDSSFDNGPDGPTTIDPDFTPGSGDEFTVVRDELRTRNEARDVRGRLAGTVHLGDLDGDGVGLELTAGGEHLDQDTLSLATYGNYNARGTTTSRSDEETDTRSLFAQAEVLLPDTATLTGGVVTLGLRRDRHSEFGHETSPFVGARVDVAPSATTLRASYGAGFRAPKPVELFDPFIGNAALGPETSESVDAGFEQRLLDGRVTVSGAWFRLRTDDLIAFDPALTSRAQPFGSLANVNRTQTTGTEWSARADLGEGFTARAGLTAQDPEDSATGIDLANRARRYGSAGVSWSQGPVTLSLDGHFSGRFHDGRNLVTYPEPRARAHAGRMRVVNLAARWRVEQGFELFARVENLLDDDYVSSPVAPAGPPLAAYFGVRLEF